MMGKRNTKERHQMQIMSLDDLVPKDHIIRKIDKAIDLSFIYDKVKGLYSHYGKENIDPVVLILINKMGDRCNPSTFSARYRYIRDKHQLKKVRFQDLRHTNATVMYRSGIKTKVMKERLGHWNISTTLDIYTHLFKEDQQEVADLFDEKFVDG